MIDIDLGIEIAKRRYLRKGPSGESEVVVRIGIPKYLQEIEFYACPFEIKGFGDVRTGYAAGIDAIQSLQLVMTMIGAKLEYLRDRGGDILCWEDGTSGSIGF